jgi:hypothetical protein
LKNFELEDLIDEIKASASISKRKLEKLKGEWLKKMEPYLKFKCYSCGAKKPGKMTLCKNMEDPNRNDEYGKDGYSNCCDKEACLKKITVNKYFKEKVEFLVIFYPYIF